MTLRHCLAICGLAVPLVLTSPAAFAVTGMQMKACEIEVLSKAKFQDLPMAAVSVYPGKKANHAHFTVRWQGLKADGNCSFNAQGYVKGVKVQKFHDGRGGGHNANKDSEWKHSEDQDGFYYDRHVDKWRDPHGKVCHTCTPENGFPDHSRQNYDDYRPKNHYERDMQKDMRNMLSDEDIANLNMLGK